MAAFVLYVKEHFIADTVQEFPATGNYKIHIRIAGKLVSIIYEPPSGNNEFFFFKALFKNIAALLLVAASTLPSLFCCEQLSLSFL